VRFYVKPVRGQAAVGRRLGTSRASRRPASRPRPVRGKMPGTRTQGRGRRHTRERRPRRA
jgi:hypothetical protein